MLRWLRSLLPCWHTWHEVDPDEGIEANGRVFWWCHKCGCEEVTIPYWQDAP